MKLNARNLVGISRIEKKTFLRHSRSLFHLHREKLSMVH